MTTLRTIIQTNWEGGVTGYGLLQGENITVPIAIPKIIGGSGGGADPKELFIASATSCYLASIVFLLERRNLPVKKLSIKTECTKSRDAWHIIHYPQVILSTDATEQQIHSVEKVLIGADRGCEIGNLLKKAGFTIVVEGEVSLL